MAFELDTFIGQVSPDAPCGEDLAYDPVFEQMARAAEGTPERQLGESITPAEEPDWQAVRDLGLELLQRTRDIRVSVLLTRALAHTDGFEGVDQGLTLTYELLGRYWDDVHPRQDPDDDYPIQRINTLADLNDYACLLNPLSRIPLTDSQALGRFNWRDIEIAEGKLDVPGDAAKAPKISVIEAAFKDTSKTGFDSFERKAAAITHALAQAQAIAALTGDKVGVEYAPDLSKLIALLQDIDRVMQARLQQGTGTQQAGSLTGSGAQQTGGPVPDEVARALHSASGDGITSREDVVRVIDALCEYFDRNEPSSPIPFLLLRAKKMLTMDFMEIMQDLAPDGLSQAESICGAKKNDET